MKNIKKASEISPSAFNPLKYQIENNFFIEITKYNSFINNISNINDLIPCTKRINIIQQKMELIKEKSLPNSGLNKIAILEKFYKSLDNYFEIKKNNSEFAVNVKNILDDFGNERITLKLIQEEYLSRYQKKLSLMTISRILRFHLNYHYRKTSVKNPKIKDKEYILMSYIFLNSIIHALELGLNITYIDEVSFSVENNNYFTWRANDTIITNGPKTNTKNRFNAIVAIDENEVLYANIFSKNITSDDFISYLEELFERIGENKINNSLFILDNAKIHVSKLVKNYIKNKNVKIITNVPYCSFFNSIELLFRSMKNITYKKNFKSIKDLKKTFIGLIDDENMNDIIKKNYIETLNKYYQFFEKNNRIVNLEDMKRSLISKKRKRNK